MARSSDATTRSRAETELLLAFPIVSGAVLFVVFESDIVRRIGLFLIVAVALFLSGRACRDLAFQDRSLR